MGRGGRKKVELQSTHISQSSTPIIHVHTLWVSLLLPLLHQVRFNDRDRPSPALAPQGGSGGTGNMLRGARGLVAVGARGHGWSGCTGCGRERRF